LVQGALWIASLRWGTLILTWPITIVLARLLTPQDFGYLALVGVFTRFASLVAQGGLPNVIVLGEALSEQKYRSLHGWSLSFYFVACAVVVMAAEPIEHLYDTAGLRWVILLASVTLIMEGLTLVPVARMRRDLRLRELPIFDAVALLTNGLVALAGAFAGLRYWALILGYISARSVYTILVLRAYALPPAWPRIKGLQQTLKDAGNLLVSGMSVFVAESSDAWVGGAVVGSRALGGYRFMIGLAAAPLDKISGILLYVAGSALGNIREDLGRLRAALIRLVRLTATLMFPIFVGIALVGADLVDGLLGEKWMPFLPALQIYCLYAMFIPIRSILYQGAVAVGSSRVVAGTGLILLFLLPPSFFLLGDRFHATGLALAWLLPAPLVMTRFVHVLRERIGFGWSHLWDALYRPFLNVAIMAIGVMMLDYLPLMASYHPLGRMVIQALAGASLYALLVLQRQKKDIQWGLDVAGPQVPARIRLFLERWT
jgi:teichuronic acid exporter